MKRAAGAEEMPYLARNPVHVNRKTDPAVADKRQPEFLFPHIGDVAGVSGARKKRQTKPKYLALAFPKRGTNVCRPFA